MQINATFIKIERYTITQVTFRPAEETWSPGGKWTYEHPWKRKKPENGSHPAAVDGDDTLKLCSLVLWSVHTVCKYRVLHPKFVRHNLKYYCRCNISYTDKLTSKFVGLCSAFALNCNSSSVVTVKRNIKYAVMLCGCDNSGQMSVLRTHLIMEVNLRLLRYLLKHECVFAQDQRIHRQADRLCLVVATLWP
jgi:hypothetical protein